MPGGTRDLCSRPRAGSGTFTAIRRRFEGRDMETPSLYTALGVARVPMHAAHRLHSRVSRTQGVFANAQLSSLLRFPPPPPHPPILRLLLPKHHYIQIAGVLFLATVCSAQWTNSSSAQQRLSSMEHSTHTAAAALLTVLQSTADPRAILSLKASAPRRCPRECHTQLLRCKSTCLMQGIKNLIHRK